jgi:hypothetical protein
LSFANPVNSRYFKVDWSSVVTPTALATQFAEIGINTVPAATAPEPATLSLLGAAGLLLIRRKRR